MLFGQKLHRQQAVQTSRRKVFPCKQQSHPTRRCPRTRTAAACGRGPHRRVLVTAADQNFYQILDVARDADPKTIKKAYKKMALKYHPDVNTSPDAKEMFMSCKTAYQTLNDSEQRRKYDRTLDGGGGFDWNVFGDAFNKSQQAAQKKRKKQPEEEFYGFNEFFSDLEKEFQERQAKKTDQPRSLWQELYDIGEEFVDFLEQGVAGREKGRPPSEQAGDKAGQSQDTDSKDRPSQAQTDTAPGKSGGAAGDAKKDPNEEIEDMLSELKRSLGQNKS